MDMAVAVWQMAPTLRDPVTNLARLETAAREGRAAGATILVTPELAITGYDIGGLDDELTDPELVGRVGEIAERVDIAIVAGLALRDRGSTWNASVIIDRTGEPRATYRKAHLFADLDRSRFAAGDAPFAMATLDGVNVATMVCYDIEFPEAARAAALAGAHLIAVPTANMTPWSMVNEHVIPTRAFENQTVVAYANHCGREGETEYLGGSLIAAPDGTITRADADDETVLVLTLDTDDLEQRRRELHLADRRPDLYNSLTDPSAP